MSARFFPNRHDALHLVNEPLAGGEGFTAMGRDDFHPEGAIIHHDHSNAMNDSH